MTDKMKVYMKITKMMNQFSPTIPQFQRTVLCMLISGILLGTTTQLSKISLHVPSRAKNLSLEKRFHRFIKNDKVDVEAIYLPFAEAILHHLGSKITVMMDATQIGFGCMALVVAVIYKERAIPLVWFVYEGKKGHTTSKNHIEALKLLKDVLPNDIEVTLLGDGEYDTVEMLEWVKKETKWEYIVRTSPNIILNQGQNEFAVRTLLGGQDSCNGIKNVSFTKKKFGPVTAIAWWEKPYKKPIYLISNIQKPIQCICKKYRKRFKIETMFSDKKGRGFHLEKTHLRCPNRLKKLLLAVAISYLCMTYLGVHIQNTEEKRTRIDRNDRTDKSLFRLGIDWLTHSLTNGLELLLFFRLQDVDEFRKIEGVR